MVASSALFDGLIDDAAMFPPGNAEVGEAVGAHQGYRRSWLAPMIGPLVVSDQKFAEVGRALRRLPIDHGENATAIPLAVAVVNTGGAGGLLSLIGRDVEGVQVVAVESALRDLDDLAGNADRVVSAAAELDETVRVFVEIPYAPGWEKAVEVVEAAGYYGKLRTGGLEPVDIPHTDRLAHQLSVLVEADLPFKATAGLHHAMALSGTDPGRPRQHGFLNLLVAVEALVDGGSEGEAAGVLAETDSGGVVEHLAAWDDGQASRVRRRFRSFGCCGVLDPVNDLVALGLVAEPQ
jgi:hypothetical protein